MSAELVQPRVSFLIPTLDRGHHVVRAVASCLKAADVADVSVQVVVLDSQSVDGSWEVLMHNFQSDPRVILVQNERGSGPTASWLAAARLATGETATFVWSDDWIAPHFLQTLLPEIGPSDHLAIGAALIRSVDCDDPVGSPRACVRVPHEQVVSAYVGFCQRSGVLAPVSPACSLFSRESLDLWVASVEAVSRSTALRERLMWRAAIGPDLLLYTTALTLQIAAVPQSVGPVAQFSSHPRSITISNNDWTLSAGYWLARVTTVLDGTAMPHDDRARGILIGRLVLVGVKLLVQVPSAPIAGLSRHNAYVGMFHEIQALLHAGAQDIGVAKLGVGLLEAACAALRPRVD